MTGTKARKAMLMPTMLVSISLVFLVAAGGGIAAAAPQSGTLGEIAPLWGRILETAPLTAAQIDGLVRELTPVSAALAANYAALDTFRRQEAEALGAAKETLRKRIELKEAERDLIVDRAELSLRSFLPKPQADLVLTAVFHGVSRNHCRTSGHHEPAVNGSPTGVEQLYLDLMAAGEKYNADGRAATLEMLLGGLRGPAAI